MSAQQIEPFVRTEILLMVKLRTRGCGAARALPAAGVHDVRGLPGAEGCRWPSAAAVGPPLDSDIAEPASTA